MTRSLRLQVIGPVILILTLLAAGHASAADPTRALPAGQLPADARLKELRDVDSYFPFTPVDSADAWKTRAEKLRRQLLVGTGLWPAPTHTPLEAVIHGKFDRDDYTVEKVYFQSFPGHYVTGNLYRPKGKPPEGGKYPVMLNPHGHWPNGRFHDAGEEAAKQQVKIGAEQFEINARYPLQARMVQLARMGCIVFFYDMEGYADSVQFEHRPGVRDSMNTKENWGLFSPQAELHLQNMMGLQTWNSIRALDFVLSLPDADPTRIGVTGASGGGTQTFMLVGADDRATLSFPCVMVSTAMQGGCTCENAPYLRIAAGNIDIAALAAPRPLGFVGAHDWTQEIMTEGYPDLKKLYERLGISDRLFATAFLQFEHNYNGVTRQQMNNFVNKHFQLGLPDPVKEHEFKPLTKEEASVWDAEHPIPAGDNVKDEHERKLVKWMTEDAAKQIDLLAPKNEKEMTEYRRIVGGAFDVLIGERLEDITAAPVYTLSEKADKGTYLQMTGTVTRPDKDRRKEPIELDHPAVYESMQAPMLFLHPKNWNGQVVIWLDDAGKTGILAADGSPKPGVAKLLAAGYSVFGVDLFMQGEFLADPSKPLTDATMKGYGKGEEAWMKAGVYTFGYNRPLFSQRVRDVLTAIKFVQSDEHHTKTIHLVGLGETVGPIAAAARAQSGAAINKAAIDTGGFRFANLDRLNHPMFLPGAVKYGDVPALLALGAPGKLWITGEASFPQIAKDIYFASGLKDAPVVSNVTGDLAAKDAADWIAE